MRSGVNHTVLTANTPHLHLPVIHVPNYMDHYSYRGYLISTFQNICEEFPVNCSCQQRLGELNYTKTVFGRGSALVPASRAHLYAPPKP